ncbi:MAG: hypothetical protein WC827_02940 [Candidatus Paceibacterota bacterium]|jgi:hypothetical protein
MTKETTSTGREAITRSCGNIVDGDIQRITVQDSQTGKVGEALCRPSEHTKGVERADERSWR